MSVRKGLADSTPTAHGIELKCIQPCIHSAAPEEGVDQLESIEVETFLEALVKVAFAIAARHSRQSEDERMK